MIAPSSGFSQKLWKMAVQTSMFDVKMSSTCSTVLLLYHAFETLSPPFSDASITERLPEFPPCLAAHQIFNTHNACYVVWAGRGLALSSNLSIHCCSRFSSAICPYWFYRPCPCFMPKFPYQLSTAPGLFLQQTFNKCVLCYSAHKNLKWKRF